MSTWKPYRREIRETESSDLKKGGKQDYDSVNILQEMNESKREDLGEGEREEEEVKDGEEEEGKDGEEGEERELSAAERVSAVIPTEGRTKRFLQSTKAIRSSSTSPNTNSNTDSNTNSKANTKTNSDPYAQWGIVDCVFCNFPWGENIFEYHNETEDILAVLGARLNKGCECAFVTKEMLPKNILEERGFLLRKVIPIRDEKKKDRAIPYSKKNRDRERGRDSNGDFGNQIDGHTGDCFISFAVVV